MPVQSFSKEQYPGIHDLLASAELASVLAGAELELVLSMDRVNKTEGPMNIAHALVQTEVDEIEAKLSAMTREQRSKIVDAMMADDPQIEALLNNWAEYAGPI